MSQYIYQILLDEISRSSASSPRPAETKYPEKDAAPRGALDQGGVMADDLMNLAEGGVEADAAPRHADLKDLADGEIMAALASKFATHARDEATIRLLTEQLSMEKQRSMNLEKEVRALRSGLSTASTASASAQAPSSFRLSVEMYKTSPLYELD